MGAHLGAQLDGRQPDAAGRAEHQQRLALLQLGPLAERVVRRAVGEQEARRHVERQGVGDGRHDRRRRHQVLGEGAVAREREHAVAHRDVRRPLPHGVDDAGRLAARRERQLGLALVEALDNEGVGEVDAGRRHADADLARAGLRHRHLLDDERLGRAERGAAEGSH